MCVTFEPAELSNTILYIGEVEHPEHGLIHVLGYQNSVKNLATGPNCMILHFPSAEPLGSANALDCSEAIHILEDIQAAAIPAVMALGSDDESFGSVDFDEVQVFDVGSYSVALSATPSKIPDALGEIPREKRPQLNREIFDWYQEHFAGYSVALCCFEVAQESKSEPLLWWYKPSNPEELHAPAIDAHDGAPPVLGAQVAVDHTLVVSVPEWKVDMAEPEPFPVTDDPQIAPLEHYSAASPVHYSRVVPTHLTPFLPKVVAGNQYQQEMINGDFVIDRKELTALNLFEKTVRQGPR